ncbi:E3 ubiquitin-protein ligase BAH1 [Morella rubra]|uniref:RING-type E3 ubiquitin transferase n=1 Tax=Morella rubra TaxID=262757 RepID=A0A6A1WJ55_9ROSI|nr:E3 ubiquitin-protein ligase BAH1 [Morella rubra]
MKFFKKHREDMKGKEEKLPGLGFQKLRKILKKCRRDFPCEKAIDGLTGCRSNCPEHCSVCEGTFFPSLIEEMSSLVGCFNERAKRLCELHLASGFKKYLFRLRGNLQGDHHALIQEGKDLLTYALMNSVVVRRVLDQYDKIHCSTKGQTFKSRAQSLQIEILQNPWLYELMAFHINLREIKLKSENNASTSASDGINLIFNGGKPSLSCELINCVKLDIDLTCSICLDIVFDPVSLTCGHIFCHMCACSAASVTIVDGLKETQPNKKCPLCREEGVFGGAVQLNELNILLSKSCPTYWEERRQRERVERIQQAKQYWENQSLAFMAI